MKTTLNIPSQLISSVIKEANVRTKKDAVILALNEYLEKAKMIKIANKLGSFDNFMSQTELNEMRENRS